MRSKSERGKIAIGLIGAGPVWDQRYREVVSRLSDRIAVRAVFDSVLSRAQHAAAELSADVVGGLSALFERPEIQGVLVLDPAWFGVFPLRLGCRFQKPVFLAETPHCELELLQELERHARDAGATVMVEFPRRHEPATNRLRELMATRLGPAERIRVEMSLAGQACAATELAFRDERLRAWLDWCGYVAGWSPLQVEAEFAWPSGPGGPHSASGLRRVTIAFGRRGQESPQTRAELHFQTDLSGAESRRAVACEHGEALLTGTDQICWQNGAAGAAESLASETSAADVMLRQFCRRVAGGLVPVAGLPDVARSFRLADAIRRSLRENRSVAVES